jgi:hypothetical protein
MTDFRSITVVLVQKEGFPEKPRINKTLKSHADHMPWLSSLNTSLYHGEAQRLETRTVTREDGEVYSKLCSSTEVS